MPRRIYSKQFIFDSVGSSVSRTYTVPAGFVAILNTMQANTATAGAAVRATVQKPPGSAMTLWAVTGFVANQVATWTGRIVLVAGDLVTMQESASPYSGQLLIYASGYLLTV